MYFYGSLQNADLESLAAAPSSPSRGRLYYDTVLGYARIWDGTRWEAFGSVQAYANLYGATGTVDNTLRTTQWITATDILNITSVAGVQTIGIAGLYLIKYSVILSCASNAIGDLVQIQITKGASTQLNYANWRYQTATNISGLSMPTVHSLVNLVAGDTIKGQVKSGATTPTYGGGDAGDFMQIARVHI